MLIEKGGDILLEEERNGGRYVLVGVLIVDKMKYCNTLISYSTLLRRCRGKPRKYLFTVSLSFFAGPALMALL